MLTPLTDDDTDRTTGASAGAATGCDTHDWETDARCRTGEGSNVDLFFSEDLHDIATAKLICAACPALAPCLQGALEREEPTGVWGGQLFLNGRILTVKRRRGRPPKVPRPEEQLPEVPVPAHLVRLLRTA